MIPRSLRRSLIAQAVLLALTLPSAALADGPSAPAASAAPVPTYNDAGMHFEAPPGWESVPVAADPDANGNPPDGGGGGGGDDATPVAAFVYHRGKSDQVAILIKTAPFDGGVDDYDVTHNSAVRKDGDAFIAKNEKITLANGMPAYFVKVNSGNEAGHYLETLEYLVCDGTRSIEISYVGGEGTFDEAKARSVFSSLYVVAYPTHRS